MIESRIVERVGAILSTHSLFDHIFHPCGKNQHADTPLFPHGENRRPTLTYASRPNPSSSVSIIDPAKPLDFGAGGYGKG